MQTTTQPTIILTPDLFTLVDEAGSIHAEIARLTAQLDKMKTTIKALGLGKTQGFVFESNVYKKDMADKINWQKIAMKFEPSHQLIAAHTTQVNPQTAINFEVIKK